MRLLLLALPLLLLLFALFGALADVLMRVAAPGAIGPVLRLGAGGMPTTMVLGAWLLESIGLIALFLMLEGRTGSRWADGLMTAWTAWIFRGPLLVLTVVTTGAGRQQAWWSVVFGLWALYTVCGLALAGLATRLATPAPAPPPPAAVERSDDLWGP
ncbi:MAG: hypothetical protein AAF772_16510 [Acidobacteriota bacterium]